MSLLTDGKLARTIAAALAGVMYPITIRRTLPGTYDPSTGGVTPGAVTDYSARGTVDSFSPTEIQAGLVQATDRKVTLLAEGLGIVPNPATDTILTDGTTLAVVSVRSDPARATWEIVGR